MKEIQLTQGKVAIVDDEDFEFLNQYKWSAHKEHNIYYAVRCVTIQSYNKMKNQKWKGKIIRMHRLLMEFPLTQPSETKEYIDHKNGNGLDNRKINLRLCTGPQNNANSSKQKNYGGKKTTSIYKGVYWKKDCKKWCAKIMFNRKSIHLGYFDNEIHAAKTYDKKSKKLFGEFAWLNFKE